MSELPRDIVEKAFPKLFPSPDPYASDPIGWHNKKIRGYLWSRQQEILESVRDNRYTAVPSCHGPGKTYTASTAAAWWIDCHPPGTAFVITTAPTDSQVKTILWREIRRRHRKAQMPGRITLDAHWYMGDTPREDEIVGLGRKPQDYDPDAFQGIHAKYILIIVDEAGGVPMQLFNALETLMTNEQARILAIGNPDDPAAYFETICRHGSGWNVIPISAFDTPNFTGEYIPENLRDELVTKTWVDERRMKWGVGSPLWTSKVLGQFPQISDDTLITPAMWRLACENIIPGMGHGVYGWDVARFGADETVGYRNRDGRIRRVYSGHKQDTVKTKNVIKMHLLQHGPTYVPAVVDVVGVGAGVVDMLRHEGANVIPFNGGESPLDGTRFANKRAEVYWGLRDQLEAGVVDLDELDEDLRAQLTAIKWKLTRRGQILIESKDDMRKRGIASPDRADAVMMSAALGVVQSSPTPIVVPTITGDLLVEVM